MLQCAIIGFGGLGKVHFANLRKMEQAGLDVRLVALCDVEEQQFRRATDTNLGAGQAMDLTELRRYTDAAELLEKETLDFIVNATPTYLHADLAVLALERGVHVFSEKPMALSAEQGRRMLDTAKKQGKKLMIGQCLRYWPEYQKLKELVDGSAYGELKRAEFWRCSTTPQWSWQNWMNDHEKSGGAAIDLHVHDTDMVNWLFGKPDAVSAATVTYETPYDYISTSYHYAGKAVTAIGEWDPLLPDMFRMGFMARFEKAVVRYDADGFSIATPDGKITPELPQHDAYYTELVDFMEWIRGQKETTVNPPESSLLSLEIALAEKESAAQGNCVQV